MNLQSLASVIGQGLIAAVLPGIQALNALMSKLMQAAETFRNFMYVLMGKKIKGSTSGVVNDLTGLENSAADLSGLQDAGDAASSGLDDATSSAKALKKALSGEKVDDKTLLSISLQKGRVSDVLFEAYEAETDEITKSRIGDAIAEFESTGSYISPEIAEIMEKKGYKFIK